MATFGPTFFNEVLAAGLGGLTFAWTGDGQIFGRENLTAAQNSTLDGVIAAHNPAATAIPTEISERQWYHALATYQPTRTPPANGGVITKQEAIDALGKGMVPAAMQPFISSLPANKQFDAQMRFVGALRVGRDSDLVKQFTAFMGWNSKQSDDLFRYAMTL